VNKRIAFVNQKEVATLGRTAPGSRAGRRLNHTLAQASWAALVLYFGLVAIALAYTEDQARQGAGVFAFYCSTCHGDRGQGLTDEFRATWAPGDQYCWTPR
jgi:mono/diheme cytochrome c family protein